MKNIKVLFIMTAIFTLFSACDSLENSTRSLVDPALVTFSSIDADIVQPKCTQCHDSSDDLDLSTYQSIIASGSVVANQPGQSTFYTVISNFDDPHPDDPLSSLEIERIKLWISNGATQGTGPAVNAGVDQNVVFGSTASVMFNAAAQDGNGGSTVSYSWSTDSTLTADLSGQNTAQLTVTNFQVGTYEFTIIVTDELGNTAVDTVNLIVSDNTPNQSPTVNAGADQVIILPTNIATFMATASDPDGTIASYSWTLIMGPNTAVLSGADTNTLQVTNLQNAIYTFMVTVTDNLGATATDQVDITVERETPSLSVLKTTVFDIQCARCHMNGQSSGGYEMNNYTQIMTEVTAGQASMSALYTRTADDSMPPAAAPEMSLTSAEKADLLLWIERGAPDN